MISRPGKVNKLRQIEKAIKTAGNRRIETPETRLLLDYSVGDTVQIFGKGESAGAVGVIIGIRVFEYDKDGREDLAYTVRLSDKKSVQVSAGRIRFLRHADGTPIIAEKPKE